LGGSDHSMLLYIRTGHETETHFDWPSVSRVVYDKAH
jgi:hypothetical protein